jgi:cytosine/adenosine deaminase-related metal-dependent hydrolase
MQSLMALATEHRLPVAMHLAETREELQLLDRGDGSLAEFLKSMGLFDSSIFPGGRRLMEFLQAFADVPRALAVHGNYFGREEIEYVAGHPNISVVYCPRTHAWFGHSEHPFRRMQDAGIRVVLGTDSRASNPDLNILSELQYMLRQHRELQVSRQLKMITTEAADALGRPECSVPLRVGGVFSATMIVCGDDQSNVDATIRDRGTYPLLLAGQRPCDPSE